MNPEDIDWVYQYLDGTISDADFAELQARLRESAELRRLWRDMAAIDAKLIEIAAGNPAIMHLLQPPDARAAERPSPGRAISQFLWRSSGALAACAIFGMVCLWTMWAYTTKQKQLHAANLPLPPVRAAVVGALTNMGVWDAICERFEKATGRKVYIAYTGDHELCEDAFRQGRADLLVVHDSDDADKLVADGFGVNDRPWAYNEMIIAGPLADPAGIRGLDNGAEALRRIAETRSLYFDFKGSGSQEVARILWKSAGMEEPEGSWVLKDENHDKWASMQFAHDQGAYVILGRLPVHSRKLPKEKMAVLVQGDPAMRRVFVVMEASVKRFPAANAAGARALADFLVSPETQRFLSEFGAEDFGGTPYFPPVHPPARRL